MEEEFEDNLPRFLTDVDKIQHDAKYDGLRGYFTNTQLPMNTVIEHYHQLWQVERAFRMSKSDLRERPVYHSKPDRIKAHLLLCFVSLLVIKKGREGSQIGRLLA